MDRSPNIRSDEYTRRMYASYGSLIGVAGIVVTLRFVAKWRFTRRIGPEDIFSLLSLICAIVMTVFLCRNSYFLTIGNGNWSESLKSIYFGQIFFHLSLFFTKLSLLLQYFKVFPSKKLRIATWVVLAITIIYGGWTFFSSIFYCIPIESMWIYTPSGKCFHLMRLLTANTIFNVVTDLLVYILPLTGLKRLMLPKSQKIGLFLVFTFGGFVCLVSILNLCAVHNTGYNYYEEWAGRTVSMWTAIEVNIAIICSCLPTLRPLASHIWTKLPLILTSKSRLSSSGTSKENQIKDFTQSTDKGSRESTAKSFRVSESSLPALPTNEAEKSGICKTFEVKVYHSAR